MLKVPATEMTISSDFAILDVKRGRKKLAKKMPPGSDSLPDDQRIPVTIHGFISHRHSGDDGVSIEFGVDVEKVIIMPSKSIGKVSAKALADGKVRPIVKQSASRKAAGAKKAARVVKGLKANRTASKVRGK